MNLVMAITNAQGDVHYSFYLLYTYIYIYPYVMYACMHVCMYVYTLRVLGMTYPLENDSDLLHFIAVSTERG